MLCFRENGSVLFHTEYSQSRFHRVYSLKSVLSCNEPVTSLLLFWGGISGVTGKRGFDCTHELYVEYVVILWCVFSLSLSVFAYEKTFVLCSPIIRWSTPLRQTTSTRTGNRWIRGRNNRGSTSWEAKRKRKCCVSTHTTLFSMLHVLILSLIPNTERMISPQNQTYFPRTEIDNFCPFPRSFSHCIFVPLKVDQKRAKFFSANFE